jgi:predicted transcriptional regulator
LFEKGLSRQQRDKAVDLISDVIRQSNTSSNLVECVRKELEREFDLKSNVIMSSKPFMDQSLMKIPGAVVMQLSLDSGKNKEQFTLSVFGLMKGSQLEQKASALIRRSQKLSPIIIDSLMSSEMKQDITKLATTVVRNAKNMVEISDQLSDALSDKYGGHWHAITGNKNMLSVDDHRKTSVFFLNMDFGDMRVSVFK